MNNTSTTLKDALEDAIKREEMLEDAIDNDDFKAYNEKYEVNIDGDNIQSEESFVFGYRRGMEDAYLKIKDL